MAIQPSTEIRAQKNHARLRGRQGPRQRHMILLLQKHFQRLAVRRCDLANPDALLHQRRHQLQVVEI